MTVYRATPRRVAVLWQISEDRPALRTFVRAQRVVMPQIDIIEGRDPLTWIKHFLQSLSDAELAAYRKAARVYFRWERSAYATTLYLHLEHGKELHGMTRTTYRYARQLARMVEAECTTRLEKYRTGIKLLRGSR